MTIDELAREAAQATRAAARQMPMHPIGDVRRSHRRRLWVTELAGGAAIVAAIIVAAVLAGPDEGTVATTPTTVTVTTTATTTAPSTTATTATSTTVAATPIVPAGGIAEPVVWFNGFFLGTAAPGSEPTTLTETTGMNVGLKMVASDRAGGFVTLVDGATLAWFRTGAAEPAIVLPAFESGTPEMTQLLDVVEIDGVRYADVSITTLATDGTCTPLRALVDLADGSVRDGVVATAGPLTIEGWVITGCPPAPPAVVVNGLTVTLDVPEYTNTDAETGAPLSPIPVTEVVVTDPAGSDIARIGFTTDERFWGVLHDFDGRRILVSREGWEPALGPRTFFIIDLACPDCGLGDPFEIDIAASAALTK